ncbi:MAG: ketoacyl-ACP synthase III [Myxococcales bacterium]|nr:ketoacyl-ACP synthase III [Myxococcales bacterium]
MTLLIPRSGVRVLSTGSFLPQRTLSAAQLAARPGSPMTEEEILRLTGIETRHIVADHEATSDLAIQAGKEALARAGNPQIDRLIVSTSSPDYPSPATACIVQRGLGLAPAACHDLSAACAGFVFGMDSAARAVLTTEERVLVIAADIRSRYVDPDDHGTFALYGDGAGAALLGPGPKDEGLLAIYLAADGEGAETIHIPAGGSRLPASHETIDAGKHFLHMEAGPMVFLTALEGMSNAAEELLKQTGMTLADVDLVVPHQPNRRILDRLIRYMRLDANKLFVNVERTGNMSSASIAVAFDEATRDPRAKPGSLLLLLTGGAGFCVAAALYRVPKDKS